MEFQQYKLIIVLIFIITTRCSNAQDVKGRPSSSRSNGLLSPIVFFHRQQLMTTDDQQEEPGFGYRLRMPSQANPKTYLDYNNNNNNQNNSVNVQPTVDNSSLINRNDEQHHQQHKQPKNSFLTHSADSIAEHSSSAEYSKNYKNQQQQQNAEPSIFTGSNNYYGIPQPSSSYFPVNVTHYDDKNNNTIYNNNNEQDKFIDNYSQQNNQNQEHPDQRQIEWFRYMQRFQPSNSAPGLQQPQIQEIATTPANQQIFQSNRSLQPSSLYSGSNMNTGFIQIPRPGEPLQPQQQLQLQPVEIPQQRFPVIQPNIPQQQQMPLVIISKQPINQLIPIPIPNQQQNVVSNQMKNVPTINPIHYYQLQSIPRINYLMTIPQMRIVTPVIRFGSNNVQLNNNMQQPSTQFVAPNYQITREPPVFTQAKIHTPVFITNVEPSKGFKYTIQRSDQTQPQPINRGESMIPVAIPQHRINDVITTTNDNVNDRQRFYKVPIPSTQSEPIRRHFYVPPYMHPFPIQNIMQQQQPSFYSNNQQQQQVTSFERVSPGETHTLPILSNHPSSQGGGDVTITIEAIPPSSSSSSSPPPKSNAAPQSPSSSQSINNSGQPLRQAVFEPFDNFGYPSGYPESDQHLSSSDDKYYIQQQQQQRYDYQNQIGHTLQQPFKSSDDKHIQQQQYDYQNQIGHTLQLPFKQPFNDNNAERFESIEESGQPLMRKMNNFQPIYGPPPSSHRNYQLINDRDESSEFEPEENPEYSNNNSEGLTNDNQNDNNNNNNVNNLNEWTANTNTNTNNNNDDNQDYYQHHDDQTLLK